MSDPLTGKTKAATRDRVARAIFYQRSPPPEWPPLTSQYVRTLSLAQADAAIAELAAID